ncbi:hypothetical protein GCM10023264_19460 [Sphingomonas daechungensis]|uniref:DUF4175 domain-containing protein n=1 Tax=Sphingomonas daechungensis TaxID=1176646 RepID=A0ABX6T2Z5_9SPHN|nr:hypothetical protein [Sphingomonas daechungensis]QNP43914.1 hypothetical protein H9L15_04650 [Sphingomonas daechungensis]
MKRIALGLLLAPFPAAFIQSVVVAMWPKKGMGIFEHPLSMFVAICLLFYLLGLFLALPLYLAVGKRHPQRLVTYGVTGALLALLPVGLALVIAAAGHGLSTYVASYNLAFFAIGGFLAGVVFWRIATPPTQTAALVTLSR